MACFPWRTKFLLFFDIYEDTTPALCQHLKGGCTQRSQDACRDYQQLQIKHSQHHWDQTGYCIMVLFIICFILVCVFNSSLEKQNTEIKTTHVFPTEAVYPTIKFKYFFLKGVSESTEVTVRKRKYSNWPFQKHLPDAQFYSNVVGAELRHDHSPEQFHTYKHG